MTRLWLLSLLMFSMLDAVDLQAQDTATARATLRTQEQFFDISDAAQTEITASWLVHAASENDTALVKLYLDAGLSPDAQNKYGLTALIVAGEHRFEKLTQLLLKRHAHPDVGDKHKRTALLEVTAVPYLLHLSSEPKLEQPYPPHALPIVKLLLDAGASPDAADDARTTPLMQATEMGDSAMIALLLSHHASTTVKNDSGWTALDVAVRTGSKHAFRQLLRAHKTGVQKIEYFAWKFSHWSGLLAVLMIILGYILARSAKVGRLARAADVVSGKENVPKLAPLECESCGAGLPLQSGQTTCPGCGTPFTLPPDYVAVQNLRARSAETLKKAEQNWRRVQFVSSPVWRVLLILIGAGWLFLTVCGHIGFIGRTLYGYEAGWTFFYVSEKPNGLVMLSLLGALLVAAACWYYAAYLGRARKILPKLPRIGRSAGAAETANCTECGGAVHFAAGALSAGCGYCGTELFRPSVAREVRFIASREQQQATTTLQETMLGVARLKKNTWESIARPLHALLGLLAGTACWSIWGLTNKDIFMTIGWVLMLPAMLYLAYALTKSFKIGFWPLALLLVFLLAYVAWASLLAGLVGSFVGILLLGILLPVQLIFLKIFQE